MILTVVEETGTKAILCDSKIKTAAISVFTL